MGDKESVTGKSATSTTRSSIKVLGGLEAVRAASRDVHRFNRRDGLAPHLCGKWWNNSVDESEWRAFAAK